MTDASRVGLALAYNCAQVLYPQGLSGASVTGRQVVLRRGWLLPSDLFTAQNIRNNIDFVTVTMSPRKMPEWIEPLGRPWRVQQKVAPTVGVVVVDGTVKIVFSGDVTPAGVVAVWLDDVLYEGAPSAAYAVMAQDTPETVAAALAAALSGGVATGAVISVPGRMVNGHAGGYGQSVRVTRRQAQLYRVSIWTADATARETLASVLDTALAEQSWISTLDGREAQLRFQSVEDVDTMQNEALYRRDYFYELVFDTLQVQWASDMLCGIGTLSGEKGLPASFGILAPGAQNQTVTAALEAMQAVIATRAAATSYPGLGVDRFGTVVAAA
ncbi:hypothetical protein [Gluconobacter kanchanaburiensis]|uniref:Uncharacterized protein n=1 Tax=Gluconobacter kanchanaburiensis NBRC 103587 TaxID=1307948 RepID=A0A511BEV9_9PROT|nr:hypothetical protein [Gluconobacter kanchanaburiensis]MBF0862297.1 hypothetical protein [Gluconobacter kanchanaburiensis]GBR68914.1 hypothetical protein AA103587_1053 [Gluconobacter kanchanaburiensis NBRC 103587]GEK96287.1 hypothetical protein GKA01_14840 [Gluconobacter kanchanaburiensis NBRC 103587]